MWEPFTEHARHAVVQAHEEAQSRGHDHLGTEHLLLALLANAPLESALAALAVEVEPLQRELRRVCAERRGGPPGQEIGFSARARRAIDLARAEADRQDLDFVACEHLLCGILRVPESAGCRALARAGVDPARLLEALQDRPSEGPRPPEVLHLSRPHPQVMGQETLEVLKLLREEVAAMRTELAGLREFLAATPPPAE